MFHGHSSTPVGSARGRGFTLIELLIVVGIIALLVSILLPSLAAAKRQAGRVVCQTNLHSLHRAMVLYTQAHRDVYPCAQDPVSNSPYYWLWMGRGLRDSIWPQLGQRVSPDKPSVLACPTDPAAKGHYEATSYAYSMAFYHSPEQINSLSVVADNYSNPLPAVAVRTSDVRRPQGKILLGEWTSNHQLFAGDSGWWCWRGRRNFVLADGAILWVSAEDIHPARDTMPNPNLTVDGVAGEDLSR